MTANVDAAAEKKNSTVKLTVKFRQSVTWNHLAAGWLSDAFTCVIFGKKFLSKVPLIVYF